MVLKRIVSVTVATALLVVGALASGGPASAKQGDGVSTGNALSSELVAKVNRYVTERHGFATLSHSARSGLTAGEYAEVSASIARYNAESTHSITSEGNGSTFASNLGAGLAAPAGVAVAARAATSGPTCYWQWSYSSHWYGWDFWMNRCAAEWLVAVAAAGATGLTLLAVIQAGLDVPNDIAAVLAAAVAFMGAAFYLQTLTCEQLGYSGASVHYRIPGVYYPAC